MVRWVKRLAAIASSIFLFAFSLYGHPGIAIIGGIINLVWVFDEKLAPRMRRHLRSWALMVNTAFLAYGSLGGGPSMLALFLAASSLLAWNAGLFLERWSNPPASIQYQYLRRIGTLSALGLLAGISAVALQGHLTLSFLSAFLLMLAAGILWLRIISEALKNRNDG
ncbi:MAG: hypothetical protein ACUVWO_17110 [Thermodesulfobacteriota bacterium]